MASITKLKTNATVTPSNLESLFRMALLKRENASSAAHVVEALEALKELMNKAMEYQEYEVAGKIMEHLGTLLLQQGCWDEAAAILEQLNYTHCLGRSIINYDVNLPALATSQSERRSFKNNNIVHVYKNVLTDEVLGKFKTAFHKNSPFWTEHKYPRSYFSYSHRLTKVGNNNLIEQLARYVQNIISVKFPKVRDAKVVEWWAHRRPHCHAHQMHFDSDNEGEGSEIRNPIASTILYLSPEGIGGPTLVTTQTLHSKALAKNGWLIFPSENCLGVFDGRYLHGVIPGKGFVERKENVNDNRRITLMLAFWDEIEIRDNPVPGASRLFPPLAKPGGELNQPRSTYTWQNLLAPVDDQLFAGMRDTYDIDKGEVPIVEVSGPIWEPLVPASGKEVMPRYDDCFQYPVM